MLDRDKQRQNHPLTDLFIRKLRHPEQGQVKYWDSVVPGFGLRVTARSKSFFVSYGQDRRIKTFGRYPEMSLKTARSEAACFEPAPPKLTNELPKAREVFLRELEGTLRSATIKQYRYELGLVDKPTIEDVSLDDVRSRQNSIASWKRFFNWCLDKGLTDHNPFTRKKVAVGSRSRFLSAKEIKALWAYTDPPFSDHLKLLLLTGQRRNQFTNYQVRENTLFFPAAIMKNRRDHIIPLTPMAKGVLDGLEPFNGWSKSKARLDKLLPMPHWTIHDLRRTHSTLQAEIGTPIHVTEAILSHVSGEVSGVAAIYNRYSYQKEMRAALEKLEKHIQAITA